MSCPSVWRAACVGAYSGREDHLRVGPATMHILRDLRDRDSCGRGPGLARERCLICFTGAAEVPSRGCALLRQPSIQLPQARPRSGPLDEKGGV